ncbi:MAG: T9SS type A sorting domain-containing protein, partial [Bacteroidota bacterium]
VEITNVRIINAAGQEVEYNTSADTMILFTETVNSIASPFDREISVFPVPASTHLTVKSSGERMEEITLFDLNGKMIYQREISSQKHMVEVKGIPSGIYQMRITGTDHVTSRKILIF